MARRDDIGKSRRLSITLTLSAVSVPPCELHAEATEEDTGRVFFWSISHRTRILSVGNVPSWELCAEAAEKDVPTYHVDLAKSGKSPVHPRDSRSASDHLSVTLSVGTPLCPYGIAYRRAWRTSRRTTSSQVGQILGIPLPYPVLFRGTP